MPVASSRVHSVSGIPHFPSHITTLSGKDTLKWAFNASEMSLQRLYYKKNFPLLSPNILYLTAELVTHVSLLSRSYYTTQPKGILCVI